MITQRTRGLNTLIALGLIGVSFLFFWGYLWVFLTIYKPPAIPIERYILYSLLVCLGLFYHAITGDFLERNPIGQGFTRVQATTFRQVSYVAVFLLIYLAAAKDKGISRVFLFSFVPLLYLMLLGTNHFLPSWLSERLFRGWRSDNTLLIGTAAEVARLRGWAQRKENIGLRMVGVLSDDESPLGLEDFPILGRVQDLPKAIRDHEVTQVVMAALPPDGDLIGRLAEQCDEAGARFLVVANLEERFRHSITLLNDEGHRFIALRSEPLENPMNRALKRFLDVAVALPIVICVLPWLTVIVWLCQRLQSPGPIFYNQARSGFHDLPFRILKFRTMHTANSDVARQASRDDARIYPAGRIFRRFSIDEFPQFINVLRGDMSVVGPRPHLPEHNDRFAKVMKNYRVRTFVKPGITGLAQVRGFRGETREDAQLFGRVESDIYYLENWSFSMDIVIMIRTAWQMIAPPKTAY